MNVYNPFGGPQTGTGYTSGGVGGTLPPPGSHPAHAPAGSPYAAFLPGLGTVDVRFLDTGPSLDQMALNIVWSKHNTAGAWPYGYGYSGGGVSMPLDKKVEKEGDELAQRWRAEIKAVYEAAEKRIHKMAHVKEQAPQVQGPIVGLRQWHVEPDGRLHSTGIGGVHWTETDDDGWVHAKCPHSEEFKLDEPGLRRAPYTPWQAAGHAPVVPDPMCGCGLHGYLLDACLSDPAEGLAPQWQRTPLHFDRVSGVIQAKGVTIVHVDGFRTQMAKVVALLDMRPALDATRWAGVAGSPAGFGKQLDRFAAVFGVPVLRYDPRRPERVRAQLLEFGEVAPNFHDLPNFLQ